MNPSRIVQAVCPYWLTSSDGSSAKTGAAPSRKLSTLILISARADFIYDLAPLHDSAILISDSCRPCESNFPTGALFAPKDYSRVPSICRSHVTRCKSNQTVQAPGNCRHAGSQWWYRARESESRSGRREAIFPIFVGEQRQSLWHSFRWDSAVMHLNKEQMAAIPAQFEV